MPLVDVIDLSSDDDELGELDVKPVKLEPKFEFDGTMLPQKMNNVSLVEHQGSKTILTRQESGEMGSYHASRGGGTPTSILDQRSTLLDDTSLPSSTTIAPAPICRQFWKAGTYSDALCSKVNTQNGKNFLLVNPNFLHSNATSHKWAFGAIAELLDNSVDEIPNGATFVAIDKITNPRNGSSALLFQDDGGGMSPDAMRHCMGFGFTDKSAKSAIGRYGNGFKTSTMRLGADAIVFSRHFDKRVLTQSVGLLSYTFLTKAGYDTVVVPMVHYEVDSSTGKLNFLNGEEHYKSNLSLILKWSPYSTESELLKQFEDIGPHGTKVIVYNLWYTDDGDMELDCKTDPKDIRISGDTKKADTVPAWKEINEQHIGYRFRYSLRVYLSILYLRMPQSFKILLRGEIVEHHNLADDLKNIQYVMYKPQTGGGTEATVITTIGFLKEAPQVNLHGFNVYHKNRLILPFWQVVNYLDSRGRGVMGILEANFVEPTHNKQDFEKTSLFQKLENRFKEMTFEYWDVHCGLLGYTAKRKLKPQTAPVISSQQVPMSIKPSSHIFAPVSFANVTRKRSERPIPNSQRRDQQGLNLKRKEHGSEDFDKAKRQAVVEQNGNNSWQRLASQLVSSAGNQRTEEETMALIQENQKLRSKCVEHEKEEEILQSKITRIKDEIKEVEEDYARLLSQCHIMDAPKQEKAA